MYKINNTGKCNKRIGKILIKIKKSIFIYKQTNSKIMAELDNIPQTQTIEISSAKLEESIVKEIQELNQKSNLLINDFGSIYIRKKQITDELVRLDEILEKAEIDYAEIQNKLNAIGEQIDEKYPQGRINIQEGTVQYQPGALTRKQLAEQQASGQAAQ
jgi:predicted nuclease with TOPRIM domain